MERLIPPSRIPTPPKHDGPAPSGWTPASGKHTRSFTLHGNAYHTSGVLAIRKDVLLDV